MGNFNRNDRGGGRRPFPRRDFGGDRGGKRNRGNRQMFKAVCSNCGKSCEVPFQPTNTKPVYCSDCFEKMGGGRKDRQDRPRFDDRRPNRDNRSGGNNFNEQLESLSKKLDRIISLLDPQSKVQKPQNPQKEKEDKPESRSVEVTQPVKEEVVFMQESNTQPVTNEELPDGSIKEEKPKKISAKKAPVKKTPKTKK